MSEKLSPLLHRSRSQLSILKSLIEDARAGHSLTVQDYDDGANAVRSLTEIIAAIEVELTSSATAKNQR